MRVFSHFKIIEDNTDIEGKLTHFLSNATNPFGLDQSDGEATQAGHVFRAVAGAYPTTIFIIVPIEDVVAAIFNSPVTAVYGKETLCVGLIGWTAGDAVHGFVAGFSALFFYELTLDNEGLSDMREIQVGIKFGCGPNFSSFDSAMIRGIIGNKVRLCALFKI